MASFVHVNTPGHYTIGAARIVRLSADGTTLVVNGDILEYLRVLSSQIDVTVNGNVGDLVKISDAAQVDVTIAGSVSGYIDGWNLEGVSIAARSSEGGRFRSVEGLDYTVGRSESLVIWDSGDFSGELGRIHYVSFDNVDGSTLGAGRAQRMIISGDGNSFDVGRLGYAKVRGDENSLDIDTLKTVLNVRSGRDNSAEITDAQGAKVFIGTAAVSTTVTVESGKVRIVDRGQNSDVSLGAGDDTFVFKGRGTATYDGGAGSDRLVLSGDGDVTAAGIEEVKIGGSFYGNVRLLDVPDKATIWYGEDEIDLIREIQDHGVRIGPDAMLVTQRGFSVTLVGGADEIFSQAGELPPAASFYDELLAA